MTSEFAHLGSKTTSGPHVVPGSHLIGALDSGFLHIAEWLSFHRWIGFEHITLVYPEDVPDLQPLMLALQKVDWIALLPIEKPPTRAFQTLALRSYNRQASVDSKAPDGWTLFMSTSEYLSILTGQGRLSDLLESIGSADAVSLCSRNFGVQNRVGHVPGDLMTTTRHIAAEETSEPARCLILRTLYQAGKFKAAGKHRPDLNEDARYTWCNGNAEKLQIAPQELRWKAPEQLQARDIAQINMYKLGSAEAFWLAYHYRKEPIDADLLKADWELFDTHGAQDRTLVDRHATVAGALDVFLDAPGLKEAHSAFQNAVRAQMDTFQNDDAASSFFQWVLAPRQAPIERSKSAETKPEGPVDDVSDEKEKPAPWITALAPGGTHKGWYHRLENHALIFVQRSVKRLVISFDNLGSVNDTSLSREPWAYKFLADADTSHLGIIARAKDWYRDPELIGFMKDKAAAGFFKQFDECILVGTSMGAFGALAFSSLMPGARVVAFSPQSTLDERLVPWETRFGMGRARDWTLPFSDGATELDKADRVYLFYDPYMELDKKHIERFSGTNITVLKTWYGNHFTPVIMRRANILKTIMTKACDGTLEPEEYYRIYRQRRGLQWYFNGLTEHAKARNHAVDVTRLRGVFSKAKSEIRKQTQ